MKPSPEADPQRAEGPRQSSNAPATCSEAFGKDAELYERPAGMTIFELVVSPFLEFGLRMRRALVGCIALSLSGAPIGTSSSCFGAMSLMGDT